MKIREGFISNSSSSSFIISLSKEMSNKLNKTFDTIKKIQPTLERNSMDKFNLSYEEFIILRNMDDVIDHHCNAEVNGLVWEFVKEVKYDLKEKTIEFVPISLEMFNTIIEKEISDWEDVKKRTEEKLCMYEMVSEEYEYYTELLEIVNENIEFFITQKENGPEKTMHTEEYENLKEMLIKFINIIETEDVWEITFNRDGNSPKTKLEQKVATLNESQFKEYLKEEYNVDVINVEKVHN